jgi:EutQ-like cupin domain
VRLTSGWAALQPTLSITGGPIDFLNKIGLFEFRFASVARSHRLSTSACGTATTLIRSCTEGKFNWYYDFDETIMILEGAILLESDGMPPKRYGVGDVIFNPFWLVVPIATRHRRPTENDPCSRWAISDRFSTFARQRVSCRCRIRRHCYRPA